MRSSLTVLGIVIGVAAVIIMVTLGNGATARVTSDISSLGANMLMVMPGQERRGMGGGMREEAKLFETADVDTLRNEVPGVSFVAPTASKTMQVKHSIGLNDEAGWCNMVSGRTRQFHQTLPINMPQQDLTPEILTAALEGLEARKAQIESQIAGVRRMLRTPRPEPAAPSEAPKRKRKLSRSARRRMAEAAKKRWAEAKQKSEEPAEAPKPAVAKKTAPKKAVVKRAAVKKVAKAPALKQPVTTKGAAQ